MCEVGNITAGAVGGASSATFNPNLMLHSCWSPPRIGPRPSNYSVPVKRDVVGALKGVPGNMKRIVAMGKRMAELRREDASR